ncbi:hypothetical protein FRC11_003549 [Ceratobasidium sp. 423]|nr:hypothetical protein FRC11_003549 [Ceratobasidium sp. 423]
MPPNQRKRVRLTTDNGSNSSNSPPSTIAGPTALPVPNAQNNSSSLLSQTISQINAAGAQFTQAIKQVCALQENNRPSVKDFDAIFELVASSLQWQSMVLSKYRSFYSSHLIRNPKARAIIDKLHRDIHPPTITRDESVATEPTPEPIIPSYSNVGCSTDPIPTPSALPPDPSPRPKSGSRPPQTPMPKKAYPLTSRPRPHQVRSNVRIVACIAGRPDALTSETPRWKAVPTDCFSTLSKELKTIAPGCTPLSFHCNQKGNLIIVFTPSTPRLLLMSKLAFI